MTAQVAVIGAGISGLSAAHALRCARPDLDLIVLEESPRTGGALLTSDVAGLPVDAGADAFLMRVPEAVRLAGEVGLGADVVSPATTAAGVWVRGRIRPLPAATVLGVPRSLRSLAASGVVGRRGVARAALDLVLPATQHDGDVAVGELVRARLGARVVDCLVDPLLGGVYAGHADRLSVDATVPQVAAAARSGRSLLRSLRRTATADAAGGPVFGSIAGGLGRLAQAVADDLGDVVRTSTRAALVERVGTAWRITLVGGRAMVVDAVVVATPAPAAARLLRFAAPDVSAELASVQTATVAIATFAFPLAALGGAPPGSGFLVPASEGRLMKACTLSSAKWAALGRGDVAVVRCSVGRAGDPPPEDDDEVVRRLLGELRDAIGVATAPVDVRVSRWPDGLPQYAVGHLERVSRIEAGVSALPGLALAGATYGGVGVPACIRSGEAAAQRVLAALGTTAGQAPRDAE